MPTPHLISYDIADPRRLRRVERLLAAVGQRVHFSLFVVELEAAELNHLHRRLARTIDPAADTLRTSPWCIHDQRATRHFGTSAHPVLPPAWIV